MIPEAGGDDFDHLPADYIREQAGIDRSDNRVQRELLDADRRKLPLGDADTVRVNVGGLAGGDHFASNLTISFPRWLSARYWPAGLH